MPTFVSRNAIANFTVSAGQWGLQNVWIEGFKGSLVSGGTLLGQPTNPVYAVYGTSSTGGLYDYVPSSGTPNLSVALDLTIDASFSAYGAKPATGTSFAVQYLSLTSGGQSGLQRNDLWTIS